jgi:uncharacterized repeat protein (TIGR04042 family)
VAGWGAVGSCVSAFLRHLEPGEYELDVFVARARAGLIAASERVREVYGFPCSQAASQLRMIEDKAALCKTIPHARVRVVFG